ncbi:hypothetical protein M0638_23415 [Roseomonas sp. NAR14]|uniref:Secreted protein n=1 Tax=Roseomonas acroporae TaxID=2937791 RepID=A0A9X1YE06_9PROT|nr:hypothetical protein [Roseomonas acroporae]MCK8787325.1 hypothetical protein [Roseomonas acroporae]
MTHYARMIRTAIPALVAALLTLGGCALTDADIAVASNGKLCHRYFTPIELDYRSPKIQAELARRAERLGHSPCDDAPYNPLTGQSGPAAVGVNPFAPLAAAAAASAAASQAQPAPIVVVPRATPVQTDCNVRRTITGANMSCSSN